MHQERDETEVIAHHEPGHAVMAWLCGFGTEFVNVHRTDDRKGQVKLTFTDKQKSLLALGHCHTVRCRILVACAGPRRRSGRPESRPQSRPPWLKRSAQPCSPLSTVGRPAPITPIGSSWSRSPPISHWWPSGRASDGSASAPSS